MEQSEQVNELAAALVQVQATMGNAIKDSDNPFFKSKYADLQSIWDACREPLTSNGLAVTQTTDIAPAGVTVVTTLLHKSGQWVRGRLHMTPVKADPQGLGSCISYARRYALAAIVGVVQVDDDGEGASGRGTGGGSPAPALSPPKRLSERSPTNGGEVNPNVGKPLELTGDSDPLLSDSERKKLFAMLKEYDVNTEALRAFCAEQWDIQSRAEIRRSMLPALVAWVKQQKAVA